MFLGATPVSIYNSSSAEQVAYLAGHCGAKVAIVENEGFMSKFLEVRDQLPELTSIITIVTPSSLPDGVLGYSALTDSEPLPLSEARSALPEDLATIIYTSGTTGNPKGVMLSHYNVVWTMEAFLPVYGWTREELVGKKVVSYLPMAHIAERMVSHYLLLGAGIEVSTCPETSMLTTFLGEVRPNIVFGVPPRVGEAVRRRDRRARCRPREGWEVQRGGRGRDADRREDDLGDGHRRGEGHLSVPGRCRLQHRAPAGRTRRVRGRSHRRRARSRRS